jgi:hypothetical protein
LRRNPERFPKASVLCATPTTSKDSAGQDGGYEEQPNLMCRQENYGRLFFPTTGEACITKCLK